MSVMVISGWLMVLFSSALPCLVCTFQDTRTRTIPFILLILM